MEELKIIVELLSKVSGDAQTILIIYFVKDFLIHILLSVTIFGFLFAVLKFIWKMMYLDSKFKQIRILLGVNRYGDTNLNDIVFKRIIEQIEQLKEKNK